ncbi:MAG: methyltransferase domain-containing protein [Acidimicrobiia bacterium]
MHTNEWTDPDHAHRYLDRADTIPHRKEGEAVLVEHLPATVRRILDLGTGNGRLMAIVSSARPGCTGLAVDFSPTMLAAATERFAEDDGVEVERHDFGASLPDAWGRFDAVVSSFAIHHVPHARKATLYAEILDVLERDGVFLNLEHVTSPTPELHRQFMEAMGSPAEDPSNVLASVEENLSWLRAAGFVDVDCGWKWRELALLVARRP